MHRALVLALLAFPALADDPAPRCDALREGSLACFAGRACLCRYERGGMMIGRPAGHRWDCGSFRPDCGPVPGEAVREDGGAPSPRPWAEPPSRR